MNMSLRAATLRGEPRENLAGRAAGGFTLLLVAAAAFLLVAATTTWHARVSVHPAGLGFLILLALCAINFPLPATPRRRVDASVSVHFAFLLLYGTPMAMVLVGATVLVGRTILALRSGRSATPVARGMGDAIYASALAMIAAGAAGAVYFGFLPQASPALMTRTENLWALPLAAAAMFGVTTLGSILRTGRGLRPLRQLSLRGHPGAALEPVVLYMIGVLIAEATGQYPWAPIAMAAPIALVYSSLRRTIGGLLLEQAVSAVEALADVVDMRDAYTFHHSQRVADYATDLATEMGMRREQVEEIRLAARVHDLGKIGVPDRVLLKAGRLSPSERELIERHPELGYEIVSRFPEYVRGRHLVLYHHERPDGLGYPHHLSEAQIPLGAAVIAVADSLDAMTSSRPYRTALSLSEAMETFAAGAGTQWHQGVVSALQRLVERHGDGILIDVPPGWRQPAEEQLDRQEAARRWLDGLARSSGRQAGRQPAASRSHATIRMPAAH